MKRSINDYRKEATLNKMTSYEGNTMSRKDWIILMKNEGWTANKTEVPSVEYSRIRFNRMDLQQQKEYEAKLDTLKTQYRLKKDTYTYVITKTEYDYAKTLNNEN